MTEAEWTTSNDPTAMLAYVREHCSERKMRLLACACCRLIWEYLTDPRSRRAVEVAERFADQQASPRDLGTARAEAMTAADRSVSVSWAPYWTTNVKASGPLQNVFDAAVHAAPRKATQKTETRKLDAWDRVSAESLREQVELIREVIGNPFRQPWLSPTWLGWEGGLVVGLAEGIYEDQAFERMPFLGDALEEAGCGDERVLDHCRRGGPHVRGCWVLDLVLGKG